MPFNQTDILIAICFVSVLCKILTKPYKINLSTKLDMWLIILMVVYFISGITSITHNGYQGFLRFGETTAVFYLTVYFLRTKEIKLSELIKVMLFVGVFESFYGILQSITGGFGANFQDNRGYLGYLGLGSSLVWHGRGTFEHFNHFGPFLSTLFLFFLPINHFVAKNKKNGNIVLAILFFGVIISYSRGTLLSLIAGLVFFLYQIQKNKSQFLLKLTPLALIIGGLSAFLKNSSYSSTISSRDSMWTLAFTAITSSARNFFFGSGLSSYRDTVWQFLPANVPQKYSDDYLAHNFILYYTVEMGIIGASIIVIFLISNLVIAFKNIKNNKKLVSILGSSISIIIVSIFIEGMFDMAFNHFVTQIWFYLILGIMYSYIKTVRRVHE